MGSCVVRYMSPPYKAEDKQLIRTLIKNRTDPPENWSLYRVTLQGHARTHAEGLKRIKKLGQQEYAYTTLSEDAGEKRSKTITQLIKNGKSHETEAIQKLLSRKNLSSDSEGNNSDDADHKHSSNESSSDSDTISAKFRSKKKNHNKKKVSNQSAAAQVQLDKKNKNAPLKIAEISSVYGKPKTSPPYPLNTENVTNEKKVTNRNRPGDLQYPSTRHGFQQNESWPSEDTANNNLVSDSNGSEPNQRVLVKIMTSMKCLTDEVRELRHSLERFMKMPGPRMTPDCFMKKYGVQKLSSIDDFLVFEGRLKGDADFLQDFNGAIDCIIESEMKKTLNAIFKKFFTQQFAMNCTAVRESKKTAKLMLKGTTFYEKLFEFVRHIHSKEEDITEKTFYKSLSSCLSNAKDWDGGRKMRAKPRN